MQFECIGKCGKTIVNGNVDQRVAAGAICPDCAAKSSYDVSVCFDEDFAGWALLSPEEVKDFSEV